MWDNPRGLNAVALLLTLASLCVLLAATITYSVRSPRFAVRTVSVSGPIKNVDPRFIESIVRKEFRGTYFTLNLEQARASVARAPWVKSVTVRRKWPRALEVRIVEHEALARWNGDQLISTEGVVFNGASERVLPHLRGPKGSEKDVFDKYTLAAQELAKINQRIAVMTLSPSHALSAQLEGGIALEFGHEQFEARLRRLIDNAATIASRTPVSVLRYDMRYGKGIAVAFTDTGYTTAPPVKTTKAANAATGATR
jgi:cell division protein FtsQ